MEARLGGDPSVANKIRAYLLMKYYKNGEWEDRIELVAGQPLWAKLYYLVRTGHAQEALDEASWIESPDRRLSKPHRDHLQSVYNAHMLHSASADPFKLALYKLMGRLEPSRRTVPQVTTTSEDWLTEEEEGGLRGLTEVLLSYGERHFDSASQGTWSSVLLLCGQFERAVAALWERPETEIEAVHLAIALAVPWSFASSFTLRRHLNLALSPGPQKRSNTSTVFAYPLTKVMASGKENLENAWELVRRIIVLAHSGPAWEELVGGFRPDGTKFSGVIEQGASLLQLQTTAQYNEQILIRAARESEANDRIPEAIKLYNLAGDYATVIACLAQALGNTLSLPTTGGENEKGRVIEKTAVEILRHYERMNRGVGRDRDAAVKLLRVREAMNAKNSGRPDVTLEIMESTDLIPMDGDVAKITRKAEEFKELHDALQRNLQVYLPLTMDVLAAVHQSVKASAVAEATRQMTLTSLRKKSRSLMVFAGILKYRMSPDVYSYLARLDVEIAL
ncbi:nucleoporin interacting component Nup93/Nic96 [Chiua virens]|nr:nucleoporin interacting component Nup93/Nic96 [Chiua virens]